MKLHWRELIVAFLMALVLWYGVSGSEKLESQVEVRVDYRGLPQGLVVLRGQVNKVTVRVRASLGMIRSLSSRDFAFLMDLSAVRKGENTLAVNLAYLPFRSGIEVMDVSPSRITLEVDSLETKVVPLEAKIIGTLPQDMVAQVSFTPAEVTLNGAASLLEDMSAVEVPVQLEEPITPGASESRRLLPLPEGVDATPNEARLSLHLGIKRKLVKVTRSVRVNAPAHLGKFIRPDKVRISVAIPESLAPKAAASGDIRAFVHLEREDLGSYSLPVQVSLPEGAELVEVDPARVTVTLEQKQAPPPAPAKR